MIIKDYSCCPPKKRPIPALSPENNYYEVDENEEPQDLSLKTRQRSKEFSSHSNFKFNLSPFPLLSSFQLESLPTQTPEITVQNPDLKLETSDFSFERSCSALSDPPLKSFQIKEENNNYLGTEGLRLISEVASKVEAYRPSVLRGPSISPANVQSKSVYTPTTTHGSVEKVTLGERGRWSYHPYLPMAVYGLPPSKYSSVRTPVHKPQPLKEIDLKLRNNSVSPPEQTRVESSPRSEGSPELRDERLTCSQCGRGYATAAGLSRHQQFHCTRDSSRIFSCVHCSKTYTSMGALKMHIRTHTLPCKCQVCGKAFSRPWLLQGHIRTHTGEKPFECHQCHRSFADRSNLRAHLQTHAEVKKYACPSCPKTFSRMSLLVKHQDNGCPGLNRSRLHIISTLPPI